MRDGKVRGVLVIPAGYGAALAAASQASAPPVAITVYTDPTQQSASAQTVGLVQAILGQVNLAATGRGPAVVTETKAVQTESLSYISYLVPSILGMALMQLGIFSAIPLVADREKLILKRLSATPLKRWQLVGSNVLMRLIVAIVQTVIIVAVGSAAFHVQVSGSYLLLGALVILGSMSFIALGYVIASFARTEDAANGMTSVIQFPMMFLSGTFFPIDGMPGVPQGLRPRPAADLSVRCPPPGDGRRDADLIAGDMLRGAGAVPGRLLRDLRPVLPLDLRVRTTYQRSRCTISESGRRPPGLSGLVSAAASAGYPNDSRYSQAMSSG